MHINDQLYRIIGAKLTFIRVSLGLSLNDISLKTGLATGAIKNIERGENKTFINKLLATSINFDLNAFINSSDPQKLTTIDSISDDKSFNEHLKINLLNYLESIPLK